MIIYFTTRKAQREFSAKGKAKGLHRKNLDLGSHAKKRWAVDVSKPKTVLIERSKLAK